MLLGSTHTRQQYESEEVLIALLLTQKRYAEAYLLLQKESPNEPSTQYNMALCNYHACNYQQALFNLDKALSVLPVNKVLTNNIRISFTRICANSRTNKKTICTQSPRNTLQVLTF
jgi:tetratricopeptide (TPR) repeat protein